MKIFLLTFLFVLPFGPTNGQNPPIGIIDFYGLRSVSEQQVRQALQIKEGESVPASREEAQRRLEVLPNVQQALLNFVCCEAGKSIPVQPFIEMLNSIVWTDRNKSSMALYQLTEKRDPGVLSELRERALPSLIEMSRWKSPGHALGPFFLLGRVGNISEDEIWKVWASGNRESLIEKVLKSVKSK